MKLPVKLEYACRVLIQLRPTWVSGEVRRVEDLAEAEKISPNYLVQILNELRTAGLVASKRGKLGGYVLARDPEEVTLEDIVKATEGALLEVNGAADGESGRATLRLWREVFEALAQNLRSRRLSQMGPEPSEQMWEI